MLFTEPVVFFFSLWAAFAWAVLYLQFTSIPLVFRTNYNFNAQETGAVFTGMRRPRCSQPANRSSNVRRNLHHLRDKRVPRENCQAFHGYPQIRRDQALLFLRTINMYVPLLQT